ncbi:F-box protein SKIP1-like [Andrographis paniculata]|uniref:F-box protein SKIP1-like n=1 Tax=Andrographis paniculata TaxID=175694 RepID=UPI0021E91156|nr:F-box protein SKIP1-like [Andrographis paniculata]
MDDKEADGVTDMERFTIAASGADWAELTHECLINILSRLPLEDRWRCVMFVCKSWHHACKDPCLNSVLDLESHFQSASDMPRFWTPEFERRIDSMVASVVAWSAGSLTEIRVRHCSDRSLSLVAQSAPNLQALSIRHCPHVTDATMAAIASGCPKIKELDLSSCYEISHKSLATLGTNCPNISTLKRNFLSPSQHVGIVPSEYLNACPQDGDSEAAAISKFMPGLLHLELQFSKLTAKGLIMISEGCPKLEYLDLSGCANVTSRDIANAALNLNNLLTFKKPNFYIPRSVYHTERYGHWQLYDQRFQTDVFRI